MLRYVRLICHACLWLAAQPLVAAGEEASPGNSSNTVAARPVKVAVFHDAGVSPKVSVLLDVLKQHADVEAVEFNGEEIRAGRLAGFDIALFPGGSGSGEAKALDVAGREQVRSFVEAGGGFLGICAGAYLASADYDWSLHLLDAKVLDRKHWARGSGNVEVSLTAAGSKLLGAESDRATILYWQGPLLAPAGKPDIPDYEVLGTFATEIAKNGAPSGVMVGTTAIARGSYGKGRVFCFSPHPERSDGVQKFVRRAILWTAGRE